MAVDARSHAAEPREAAFLPRKKTTALEFPRRLPHKLSRTPPTSGSERRRHAAQAEWAGACARARQDGGGKEPRRGAPGGSGRGQAALPGGVPIA